MVEFDFATDAGREKAKKDIEEIVNNNNKTELIELLFGMMDFIVKHEVNFENIKAVLWDMFFRQQIQFQEQCYLLIALLHFSQNPYSS